MPVAATLDSLAALVDSADFRASQDAFFAKYANEFDAAAENKLSYTAIHKEYVTVVEDRIAAHIGASALAELLNGGLAEYLATGDHAKSAAVAVVGRETVMLSLL